MQRKHSNSLKSIGALASVALAAAAFALTISVAISGPADAKPQFASQTGKPCTACHTNPPQLNANGKAFKANGFKEKK